MVAVSAHLGEATMSASLILLGLLAVGASALPSPHIINGDISQKGKWPWQISLQALRDSGKFSHSCGGSLITKNWVLTAAHCVMFNPTAEDYRVKLGMFSLEKDDYEQVVSIKRIVEHPEFSIFNPGLPNDICLLELAQSANLTSQYIDTISLVKAADGNFANSENCWITGWGRDDRDSPSPSVLLREKKMPMPTKAECEGYYEDVIDALPVLDSHVCVGRPDKLDVSSCHGDSGGPLACDIDGKGNFRLAGACSRGGPTCEDVPAIYTRVSSFLDWVQQTVPGLKN